MQKKPTRLNSTDTVHAGDLRIKPFDSIPQAVVHTSTYTFNNIDEVLLLTSGKHPNADKVTYGRYGNPTCRAVELRMAKIEATEDALLFSNGMAAISTTVLALINKGQHVILFKDGYRMTREFLTKTLENFSISCTLIDLTDINKLDKAIRKNTCMVISEYPTNPHLSCIDLKCMAAICKKHGVLSIVDSTFATPVNIRPSSYGADLIVHSATKYIAGHNDVLAGFVCGKSETLIKIRKMRGMLGTICDPHTAFLVGRGMKTLALRVQRQNESAIKIARYLSKHPSIERVYYPGLTSHPSYSIAKSQMHGFGGVISFTVKGGFDAVKLVVERLRIARISHSFGGVESVVELPAIMSHYELTSAQRNKIGIYDNLVRFSVGIEDVEDLLADLKQALG